MKITFDNNYQFKNDNDDDDDDGDDSHILILF